MSNWPDPVSDSDLARLLEPPGEAGQTLATAFGQRLQQCQADLSVRPEQADDLALIHRIYAGTRLQEMSVVDWPESQRQAFLQAQSRAQIYHYRSHYPDACFLLVSQQTRPMGRIYLSAGSEELRLMDIALLPEFRGLGWGRSLMQGVVTLARDRRLAIGLHVEPFNPARDWYLRLGFTQAGEAGYYHFLRLERNALAGAQEKLI